MSLRKDVKTLAPKGTTHYLLSGSSHYSYGYFRIGFYFFRLLANGRWQKFYTDSNGENPQWIPAEHDHQDFANHVLHQLKPLRKQP